MRPILMVLLVVCLNGCVQSQNGQRPTDPSTPIKFEMPGLSARAREKQKRDSEQDQKDQSVTVVEGNIVR